MSYGKIPATIGSSISQGSGTSHSRTDLNSVSETAQLWSILKTPVDDQVSHNTEQKLLLNIQRQSPNVKYLTILRDEIPNPQDVRLLKFSSSGLLALVYAFQTILSNPSDAIVSGHQVVSRAVFSNRMIFGTIVFNRFKADNHVLARHLTCGGSIFSLRLTHGKREYFWSQEIGLIREISFLADAFHLRQAWTKLPLGKGYLSYVFTATELRDFEPRTSASGERIEQKAYAQNRKNVGKRSIIEGAATSIQPANTKANTVVKMEPSNYGLCLATKLDRITMRLLVLVILILYFQNFTFIEIATAVIEVGEETFKN